MKHLLLLTMLTCLAFTTGWTQVVKSDFDGLTLEPESYWDGSDRSKGFASGDAYFVNSFDEEWEYWDGGFVYSNTSDVTTGNYLNDFSAITGKDYSGNGIYAVGQAGYGGAVIKLTGAALNTTVTGFYATNTTYAALVMKNGNSISKVFGGETGNDPDYFKLIIQGYSDNALKTEKVEFYLADFRNTDNSFDYILKNWRWVDLRPLGNVDSLLFTLESSDNNSLGMLTPAYFVIDEFNAPLFSPRSDKAGSGDISRTNTAFVNWASSCTVTRGPQDIATPSSPLASVGADTDATGPSNTSLVSLGDGGSAVLTFPYPIMNGEGPDFAVFENAFANSPAGFLSFAELAFVEVSSDGENFFRFPAVSNTNPTVQTGPFAYTDPQLLYNLAGAGLSGYGTPFDLEELSGIAQLDINKVTHVKVVDVVGSINPAYATYDKNGNAVNDPWKTAFTSGGFDLEAVGVLHENPITGIIASTRKAATISVYPNPAADQIHVSFTRNDSEGTLQVLDMSGNVLTSQEINSGTEKVSLELTALKQGIYVMLFNGEAQQFIKQ